MIAQTLRSWSIRGRRKILMSGILPEGADLWQDVAKRYVILGLILVAVGFAVALAAADARYGRLDQAIQVMAHVKTAISWSQFR